jgi:tetratricopeptide (TPR) repeat protein
MQQHQDKAQQLKQLLSYLRQDPNNDKLRIAVYDAALTAGEFAEANFQVVHARHVRPDDIPWRHREALLLLAQGQYAEARERFERLIADGFEDPTVSYNLAYALFGQGATAQARDLAAPLRAAAGDLGGLAWVLWLRCEHRLSRVNDALQAVDDAAAAHALPADAWGVASLLALDAGRGPDALAWSRRALAANPVQMEALVARGTLALGGQDVKSALALFERALQLNGADGRSWSGLAFGHLRQGDFPAAQAAFKKAVAHMPDHIGTWIGLGWCEFLAHQVHAARATFEHALSMDRNFGESHGSLAVALARLNLIEEAKLEIELALRLDRRSLSARYAQAILSGEADDPEAFRRLSRRVLEQRSAGIGNEDGKTLADIILRQ